MASGTPRDFRPWAPKAPKATDEAADREPRVNQFRGMVGDCVLEVWGRGVWGRWVVGCEVWSEMVRRAGWWDPKRGGSGDLLLLVLRVRSLGFSGLGEGRNPGVYGVNNIVGK